MQRFNNINDIEKHYNYCLYVNFKNYICYNDIILNIFNSTVLNINKYDLNDCNILLFIGMFYQFKEKNYDKMKYYYLTTIKHNCSDAMYCLGYYYYYYHYTNKYEQIKYYYLMAIKHNCSDGVCYLGSYYFKKCKYNKMKYYCLMAVKNNHVNAMYYLGFYYNHVEKNYNLMKYYYLIVIKNNNKYAMHDLGYYYGSIEKNYNKMKYYYLMAINLNFNMSMHNLKNHYECNNKITLLYLILIHLTQNKLISKTIIDLKNNNNEIQQFENKINLSIKLNNYKKCELCNNDNILNIKSTRNIESCIECYTSN